MDVNVELLLMVIGFTIAAYSIVANDAIQTLGTFLSSNSHRPWWVLWLFAMLVLTTTLVYGWVVHGGDVSYGRLTKFPQPAEFSWVYLLPPIFVFFLTRFGIPVSTTFLILTVFASTNLEKMLTKSLLGYLVAIVVGFVMYSFVVAKQESEFLKTADQEPPAKWVVLQWMSTAFLWSQWLTQDLANIYVYAPSAGLNADGVRTISLTWLIGSLAWILILHAIIFYRRGGKIQRIVLSKTNTTDIRSATIIDFLYGVILFIFKEMSNIPMSTTWVFLGLLGGREFAIAWVTHVREQKEVWRLVGTDMGKLVLGLLISIALAFSAPTLKDFFSKELQKIEQSQLSIKSGAQVPV